MVVGRGRVVGGENEGRVVVVATVLGGAGIGGGTKTVGGGAGGGGGGGGCSKSVGGTPSRAWVMNTFQVSAGMEPPVTRETPLMLNSEVGLVLSPIHTAVDSVGV